MEASTGEAAGSGLDPETFRGLKDALGGLGVQERQATRVRVGLRVRVTAPIQMCCETVDLSVLGARFNRELPCAPGMKISFTVGVPRHGGAKPRELQLEATVVRVQAHDTGVQFIGMTTDHKRAVRAIVCAQQNLRVAQRAVRHGLLRAEAS